MKIYAILILSIFTLTSCENKVVDQIYPNVIKQNNLEDKYDLAKWIIYAINSDDTNYISKHKEEFFIAKHCSANTVSSNLVLDSIEMKHDTIIMTFNFYYTDKLVCSPKRLFFFNQVYFWGDSDTVSFLGNECCQPNFDGKAINEFLFSNKFTGISELELKSLKEMGFENRTLKKCLSDFPEYLKKNIEIINPWLKNQAIKKGIIE